MTLAKIKFSITQPCNVFFNSQSAANGIHNGFAKIKGYGL